LRKLVGILEQGLLLVIWLVMAMGLFYPWENFSSPGGDALGDARVQGTGTDHAVYLILFCCICLIALLRWKGVIRTLGLAWPFLVLCGWIVLSALWATDPAVSLSTAGRFMILIIFSAYVSSAYDSLQFVAFLTRGFAIAVAASLAVMILAPRLGFSNLGGGYGDAWRGAFTHKNWLGAAMSVGTLVGAYSYGVRANHRLLSGATFIGCLFLLIMSRSATSIVSTLVAFLVAILGAAIQNRRVPVLRAFALMGLLATVVLALLYPLMDINLKDLPRLAGRSSDLTGRAEVWRAVWAAIQNRPLTGYGYGFWTVPSVTRSNIWLSANWEVPHSHNNWLDAGLQLGLVGVVIAAFIWLSALRRAMWLIFVQYGHGALLYLTILFGCLTKSAVETVTFAPGILSLFWWVTSYIYIARIAREKAAATNAPRRSPAPDQRPARRWPKPPHRHTLPAIRE
jgi:exopolysaccharide production protein ExoQ